MKKPLQDKYLLEFVNISVTYDSNKEPPPDDS